MARDRMLPPRWLVWLVLAWSVAIAAVPRVGDAAPLPPERAADAASDADAARVLAERRLVQARLARLGVSETEAAALWERLTPAERAEVAERVSELQAGGDPVAAGVAIAIIVAMLVILALELIGRRVISRPATGAEP
jgi:hypothetical protein